MTCVPDKAHVDQLSEPCQRGQKGRAVWLVQEWLSLRGEKLAIDGDFGPATERVVRGYQARVHLPQTGVVNAATFAALTEPMRLALNRQPAAGLSLSALALAYAREHLENGAREVGGDNAGPWVRLYMNGREGPSWRWCAGFVSFCLRQAAETLDVGLPIKLSFSCDSLAAAAERAGLLLSSPTPEQRRQILPGSLFLVRRTPDDWTHVGLVQSAEPEVFRTIEGNTNDDGSPDGYEVAALTRGYGGKDFIVFR